jgi:lipopolysaccharide biosynthesis regulator YciM
MPDDHCSVCGFGPHAYRLECPECTRRWEEMQCRELRERLFGPIVVREPLSG